MATFCRYRVYRSNTKQKKAFTLLEVLIVLVVLAGLGGYLFRHLSLLSDDYLILERETILLSRTLETARERATQGEAGQAWGVALFASTTGSSAYVLFSGPTFAQATTSPTTTLNQRVVITIAPTEVIFAPLRGRTTSTAIVLQAPRLNRSFTITIPTSSAVEWRRN